LDLDWAAARGQVGAVRIRPPSFRQRHFTVLALLLGFSFSLALGRYDWRRTALVREAAALGTTYVRVKLPNARDAAAIRADANPERRAIADAKSSELQRDMWRIVVEAAHRDPRSTIVPLLINELNDTINLSTEEAAVLVAHIPDNAQRSMQNSIEPPASE
jgi:hypothetical protein